MPPSDLDGRYFVGKSVLKGLVAIVGLLFVRSVLSGMPMIAEAEPVAIPSLFSSASAYEPLSLIIRALVDTFLFAAIIGTAYAVRRPLNQVKGAPFELGTIALIATAIVVLVLAYSSYESVLTVVVGSGDTYNLIFVFAGVLATAALLFVAYRNLDGITDLVFRTGASVLRRARRVATANGTIPDRRCGGCGCTLGSEAKFCGQCGQATQPDQATQ